MKYLKALLFILIAPYLSADALKNECMVVSEHTLATQSGVQILREGGNAIDAAVAVGYALAVVNPCCGNLGGGGFMIIHLANGHNIAINFREKAPLKATSTLFLNKSGQVNHQAISHGYLAVAVPGTVLGFETAHQKYGHLSREQVMAPAIKLAQEGYRISPYEANQIKTYLAESQNEPNVASIFFKNGQPLQAGDLLIQTDLAKSLTLIAQKGADAFYKGPIAHAIVKASEVHHGILSLHDFLKYTVKISNPLTCHYHDYTIFSAPPPSTGGNTLCTMLQTLEPIPLKQLGYQTPKSIDIILKTMKKGFQQRNQNTPENPSDIFKNELTDTTHFSIVDKYGNAVSVTYTLNGFFGAGVIAGNTGFFLNNEMDDFTAKPGAPNKFGLVQSTANTISPGKQPISSMTPSIILKNKKLFMVIGSPGGPRIITAVLLSLLNVLDYGMTIKTAVNSPRYHYQAIPDVVYFEENSLPKQTLKALIQQGYHFKSQPVWGAVEAIIASPTPDKKWIGVNDYRRPDGSALPC